MRSDDKPQLSHGGRRRLAITLAGLAAAPAILLVACGNADQKVSQDTRPDARASTEGARSAYPMPVSPIPVESGRPLSGMAHQQAPVDANPGHAIPPEDLVSQQGFGRRNDK